jgi:cell division protein ZapA
MGEESERITEVKIYNRTYNVLSSNDPEYVKELARFVDERMREVSEQTPTVDTMKVAILAALNIADQYFAAKGELRALEEKVSRKGAEMCKILEPFLNSKSP